jgi:peptide/nickel transport system substrate-binding protein
MNQLNSRFSATAQARARLSRRALITAGSGMAALTALARIPVTSAQATPDLEQVDTQPVRGGVLRVGVQGDPASLDPHLNILDAAGAIFDFVYEGLVLLDPQLVPRPAIAESWTISEAGLVYTFALRPGVTFHNGREVTSEDVRYSFSRVMDPETASPDVAQTDGIASIEPPDAGTVVMTLTAPDASFLTRLSRPGLAIIPQEEVERHGDLSQVMVGTGPFIFEEYVPNTRLTFSRNDAYWDGDKPFLDGLDVLIIPDDTTRTAALVSNTVDLIQQVPHRDIPLIEANDSLQLAGDQATNLRWIVFNLQRSPFDNIELRQAIAAGIDRQAIIDSAVFGYGTPLVGMYPSTFWFGYQGDVPEPDVEGARALVERLDLPEDFRPAILTFADYEFLAATSTVFQEQLRQIGIESEIDAQDNATYLDNLFSGNFDIAVMGASGYSDPSEYLTAMLGTGQFTNPGGYSNPDLDALIQAGLEERGQAARATIYQQAQQIIIDELPIISLYTSNTYEGLSTDVEGFEHSLTGRIPGLRSTWLDR